MLFTDKQTDKQTNQRYQKHNLLCQGGNKQCNFFMALNEFSISSVYMLHQDLLQAYQVLGITFVNNRLAITTISYLTNVAGQSGLLREVVNLPKFPNWSDYIVKLCGTNW